MTLAKVTHLNVQHLPASVELEGFHFQQLTLPKNNYLGWLAASAALTVAANAATGSGLGPKAIGYVLGIAKAYTTRVGSGPFPTEQENDIGEYIGQRGREFGTVTGRKRRCGWFDSVLVRQAIKTGGIHGIALTKLDVLDDFETIKICTGYRLDGELLEHYPDRSELIADVEPVYVTLPGWGSVLSDTREPGQLPPEAKRFIEIVEEQVGVPVKVVGVGAERDDYLVWAS